MRRAIFLMHRDSVRYVLWCHLGDRSKTLDLMESRAENGDWKMGFKIAFGNGRLRVMMKDCFLCMEACGNDGLVLGPSRFVINICDVQM